MSDPVTVIYLGKLADIAGGPQNRLDVHAGPLGWKDFVRVLEGVAVGLGEAASADHVKIAVNGNILHDKQTLTVQEGDEVALLPPVSGG